MKVNLTTFEELHRPMYVLEERLLRRNLELIRSVAHDSGAEIILAFKAYVLWKTFPLIRQYVGAATASSLYEARLAAEEFGSKAHTFSPAYTSWEMPDIARCSSHLTFNSLSQYARLHEMAREANPSVSFGLRVNPEYSEVGTDLYNPCAPGTRFGVPRCRPSRSAARRYRGLPLSLSLRERSRCLSEHPYSHRSQILALVQATQVD